jgi:hypothetical protein
MQGSNQHILEGDQDTDDESVSSSESEEEAPVSPKTARREKLERLAKEYEDSVKELQERKARGEEVCEMCSS